jgi:hypothetical protein
MIEVIRSLNKIAGALSANGQKETAGKVNEVLSSIAVESGIDKTAQELIAAEELFIKEALDDCEAANADIVNAERIIEAARKRKKKWVQQIGLKKGRFTEYCKSQGFKGPCEECAKKALKSPDKSVRGMAGFYKATQKFKKNK